MNVFKSWAIVLMAIMFLPKLPQGYYNRGDAYLRKGDLDKAISDFTDSIRLAPEHADTYAGRGLAYSKKGEHDKAIADYTEEIRLNPRISRSILCPRRRL